MGAHYGSIHFRTTDRDGVLAVLKRVAKRGKLRFYLAPTLNGWTTAYPSGNGQDFEISATLASEYSCDICGQAGRPLFS
jgi:hypothetical protein